MTSLTRTPGSCTPTPPRTEPPRNDPQVLQNPPSSSSSSSSSCATQTPTATPTAATPATSCAPAGDEFGASPLEQAAAFLGVVMLREAGLDANVLAQNPELKADVDKLIGMARGVGASLGIDLNKLMLPDAQLRGEAKAALQEGRVDGKRHARVSDADVDGAMSRDWTPARGRPTGATGVVPLSQLDSNALLGNGPRTIRQAGCLLTSMTMVSNATTGASRTPAEANQALRANGGFSGSMMNTGPAANALGMRLTGRASFNGNTAALDRALQAGRPVVAGVDYKAGSSSAMGRTDHFVCITGKNADGSYSGIDSAGGRALTFRPDGNGGFRAGRYSLSEVMTFERR